ncbi:MAG TPA: ATP-binding protein [Polyangiaceae bacterium]|nr:ATP-binding protein [Polyangiaceae bacterium]
MLPLRSPDHPAPYGALICGISPHRLLDAGYRAFFELAAGQIVTALRNALALEYERKRAEALAEFDRAKTQFFSNISHEFRTPLALIAMPIEEALASPAQALEGEDLQAAHRNVKRLLKLVNQLLDFARIEAKRAQVSVQPTDLCALTIDLASAFRSMLEHVGLRLEIDCPPLDAPVLVDPDMWEKIVLNLLSNAFKFTFQGGISVSLRQQTDSVELRVRDTGIGIAPEQLPRLFDRFHRVEGAESRSHEGSGIGLALVADLIRLQGGRISVESKLGRGTTFSVQLPRRLAHPAATAVTASGAHKQAFVEEAQNWLGSAAAGPSTDDLSGTLARNARILVADDNADMRAYLTRLLGRHWSVTAVSDGLAALAAARAEHPDLVLADVMMPRLDGFGLVRELRADPALATIPILLVSARAGEEAIGDGLRQGADDYITKPFSASHLLVRIEAQLNTSRKKSAAYEERRRLYRALAAAPNPILLLSGPEHVVELVNRAGLEIWGKDDSVVGKPLSAGSPELAGQPFIPLLDEVRRSGRPVRQRSTLARLDTHRTGELVDSYFDFVFEPVLDAGGVELILVVALDVTHQVRAQQVTQAALDEAQRANKIKDDFLALLGHELRNPMAPIMTALELMKYRGDREITREREVIERQARHLLRLVDDLLDVARIARGVVELKRRRTPLAELVSKAVETVSPLFTEKRHRLNVNVDSNLQVDADPERLLQVLSNLLTNAAKYTNQGGEIDVSARADEGQALIVVRDNGIGITPEILPHVFEMFVQERQGLDRSRGGLGIGLAIVQGLVRQHGGSVRAYSAGPGHGSRFELLLPLAQGESRGDGAAEHKGRGIPCAVARARVLVVDDNQDAAELLATAIEAMGHQAQIAYDGASALQVAESFQPDVAVLDIGLPIMDGYELARRLRASVRAPQLVALTGYGQERDKQESLRAGFQAHLVKPVDIQRLAVTIESLFAS